MSGELLDGYYVRPASGDGVWRQVHIIARPKRVRVDAVRFLYWPEQSRPSHEHFTAAGLSVVVWPQRIMSHDTFRREFGDYKFEPSDWRGPRLYDFRALAREHRWRKAKMWEFGIVPELEHPAYPCSCVAGYDLARCVSA